MDGPQLMPRWRRHRRRSLFLDTRRSPNNGRLGEPATTDHPGREGGVVEAWFDGDADSVREARHWLRSVLGRPHHDAELVVSELATNAVDHAHGKYLVRVDVGSRVRIEVTTTSTSVPWCGPMPSPDAEHGRGLPLIDAVASSWWIRRDSGLCTVGAELDTA